MRPAERFTVALVRGFHGLRGDVRVEVLTDRPEDRFAPGARLFREGSSRPLTIAAAAAVVDGPGWRIRFAEVPDRTAAETLRDAYLEADVDPVALPEGGHWWHEIVGASVRDVAGNELGRVVEVYRAGGAEVFLVRGATGEFDVPAVAAFVPVFAPDRGEIVVDTEALGLASPRKDVP